MWWTCPNNNIYKNKKNVTFGGYTEVPFYATKKKKGNKDDNAFLFSFNKWKYMK